MFSDPWDGGRLGKRRQRRESKDGQRWWASGLWGHWHRPVNAWALENTKFPPEHLRRPTKFLDVTVCLFPVLFLGFSWPIRVDEPCLSVPPVWIGLCCRLVYFPKKQLPKIKRKWSSIKSNSSFQYSVFLSVRGRVQSYSPVVQWIYLIQYYWVTKITQFKIFI